MTTTENTQLPLVSIRCLVYNHEPYLRDCLEGFVMQKTTFSFEAIVHDDASTDGSAAIIREYAEKYPHIIKPIYQTVNQYSQGKGGIGKAIDAAMSPDSKYIALCEGDDYWIDPNKLQMQVDWLENHQDYSMCWTDGFILNCTNGQRFSFERYKNDCDSPIEDIIELGGEFIPTCSILHRKHILYNRPAKTYGYSVGDYPLQMWCAYVGKVRYLHNPTCIYRLMSQSSWTLKILGYNKEKRKEWVDESIRLLNNFNEVFEYKHEASIEKAAAKNIYKQLVGLEYYDEAKHYLKLRKKYKMHIDKVEWLMIYDFVRTAKLLRWLQAIRAKIKRKAAHGIHKLLDATVCVFASRRI